MNPVLCGIMWPKDGLSLALAGGLTLPALVSLVKGHASATGGWQLLQDGLDAWASLGWDKDFSFNVGKVLRTGALACLRYRRVLASMSRLCAGAALHVHQRQRSILVRCFSVSLASPSLSTKLARYHRHEQTLEGGQSLQVASRIGDCWPRS